MGTMAIAISRLNCSRMEVDGMRNLALLLNADGESVALLSAASHIADWAQHQQYHFSDFLIREREYQRWIGDARSC